MVWRKQYSLFGTETSEWCTENRNCVALICVYNGEDSRAILLKDGTFPWGDIWRWQRTSKEYISAVYEVEMAC